MPAPLSQPDPAHTTLILNRACAGDRAACDALLDLAYDELRRLAQSKLAQEVPGHSFQPTDLVHEAYERLIDQTRVVWNGKGHFMAEAARAMRRILIDRARRNNAAVHGGGRPRERLDESVPGVSGAALDTLAGDADALRALDEALRGLRAVDERTANVVELRELLGKSVAVTAEALGIGERTVKDDYAFGMAWLRSRLGHEQ